MARTVDDHTVDGPEAAHDFYEGKWTSTDRGSGSLKNLLIKKERFFVRQLRGEHGTVLDLGCGGGWYHFARIGPVAGLDLSHASLCSAKEVYSLPTQGLATALPYADESFALVVSLDFIGHVPIDKKDLLLSEIYRVLRSGGKTLHYIETLSADPLNSFARRHPDLYERYLIAPDGHVGIETPTATYSRFRAKGFEPVSETAAYKGAVYVERFVRYFDNEYRDRSLSIRLLVALLKPIARLKPLALAANLLITAAFELFDPLLPQRWAGGVLVCYTKPAAKEH
ncbi:MAG: class I SAM-dependent methyltransferase [Anaerolineales bacterium]|nr:MAG: class I SAM-dependent methyltransferase [Anaerolineales bacterium]